MLMLLLLATTFGGVRSVIGDDRVSDNDRWSVRFSIWTVSRLVSVFGQSFDGPAH